MKLLIENITSVGEMDLQNKPDYVTDERWERVCRIRPIEDKKRSLLAGKLLDQMCRECDIEEPEYGVEMSGKPILLNAPELAFNLSHSGEYVLLAYKKGVKSIGVDVQKIRNASDGLKRRLLHTEEWRFIEEKMGVLEGTQTEEALVVLNRIWAIKESFVKMTGEGLSHDFRKICIDFEKKEVSDEMGRVFSFLEPDMPKGYVAAVTINK